MLLICCPDIQLYNPLDCEENDVNCSLLKPFPGKLYWYGLSVPIKDTLLLLGLVQYSDCADPSQVILNVLISKYSKGSDVITGTPSSGVKDNRVPSIIIVINSY